MRNHQFNFVNPAQADVADFMLVGGFTFGYQLAISDINCNMGFIVAAVFGGYVIASMLVFKYPNLIHKRKKLKFTCRHISHRGGAGENYENTMIAFRRALQLGTDMLELDCHLTKDEHVVVSHDHNLLRSTGSDCDISQLNYKDLPLLKAELPLDFDPGHSFVGSGKEEERKFALLKDVFEQFPNVPINIDIKIDDDRLIHKVSDLITQFKREEYTVWGNSNDSVTKKCYTVNPRVNLLFSLKRVVHLILLLYSGLLPFCPIKETHLEIFLPCIYLRLVSAFNARESRSQTGTHRTLQGTSRRKSNPTATYLPWHAFVCRVMDCLLMKRSLFEHLEKRGIQTYLWVLNYEDEFKKAFELGATGVMTDYPSKLRKFLDDNPEYQ